GTSLIRPDWAFASQWSGLKSVPNDQTTPRNGWSDFGAFMVLDIQSDKEDIGVGSDDHIGQSVSQSGQGGQRQQASMGQESILKSITKRLNQLERNATLAYKYLEEQSHGLNVLFEQWERETELVFREISNLNRKLAFEIQELKKEIQIEKINKILEKQKEQLSHLQLWNIILLLFIFSSTSYFRFFISLLKPLIFPLLPVLQIAVPDIIPQTPFEPRRASVKFLSDDESPAKSSISSPTPKDRRKRKRKQSIAVLAKPLPLGGGISVSVDGGSVDGPLSPEL
ncbi:hypothetical protein HK096_001260, partial [Nowakowskiella sp. JEL0078]